MKRILFLVLLCWSSVSWAMFYYPFKLKDKKDKNEGWLSLNAEPMPLFASSSTKTPHSASPSHLPIPDVVQSVPQSSSPIQQPLPLQQADLAQPQQPAQQSAPSAQPASIVAPVQTVPLSAQVPHTQIQAPISYATQAGSEAPHSEFMSTILRKYSLKLWAHKDLTVLGTVLFSYGAIIYKLMWAAAFVKSESAWLSWKGHISEEGLIRSDAKNTAQELIHEITIRYDAQPLALPYAIDRFLRDTTKEMKRLQSLISWHSWIDFFMMSSLFPNHDQAIQDAHVKLIKLEYMQYLAKEYQKGLAVEMKLPV